MVVVVVVLPEATVMNMLHLCVIVSFACMTGWLGKVARQEMVHSLFKMS